MVVHRYKRLAALDEEEYRSLMARVTSCQARSSTAPDLTNGDFDTFMAHLEAQLDWRIKEGLASPTHAGVSLTYWRNKLPRAGKANSRQIHEIYDWWHRLGPFIPAESRTPEYLRAIAAKASHSKISAVVELSARHAGLVIEALKDRLRTETKRRPDFATAELVPQSSHGSVIPEDEEQTPF
jgi:hypothetical protein